MEIKTVHKKRPYLPLLSPPVRPMQAPVERALPVPTAPSSSSGNLIAKGLVASATEMEQRLARAQSSSGPSTVHELVAANSAQAQSYIQKGKTKYYYSPGISSPAVQVDPRSVNPTGSNNGIQHSSRVEAWIGGPRVATTGQVSNSSAVVGQNSSSNRKRKQDISNLRSCNSMSFEEQTNRQSQAFRPGASYNLARTSSVSQSPPKQGNIITAPTASLNDVPSPFKRASAPSGYRTYSGQGNNQAVNTSRTVAVSLVSSSAFSVRETNKAQQIGRSVDIQQKASDRQVSGSKRSAELPRGNGPRPSKEAKATASTSSVQAKAQQSSGNVSLRTNESTARPSPSSASNQLAGTRSSSSRRQAKQLTDTSASPSSSARTNGPRRSQAVPNESASSAPAPKVNVAARVIDPPPNNAEYCWKCHLVGADLHCSRCPLSWHKDCSKSVFTTKANGMIMIPGKSSDLKSRQFYEKEQAWIKELDSVLDHSVCVECARKEAGLKFSTEKGILKGVTVNENNSTMRRVSRAFKYAIESLMMESEPDGNAPDGHSNVRAFAPFFEIVYGDHEVVNPIDLTLMLEKVEQVATTYRCVEDFMFDIQSVCHSYLVLTQKMGNSILDVDSSHRKLCDDLINSASAEMQELDRCESCYLNHYEVNMSELESAMLMPCEHTHSLVWLKHHRLWWPAKVYAYRESKYYFESEKYAWVVPFGDEGECKWTIFKQTLHTYSANKPDTSDQNRRSYRVERDKAIDNANEYTTTYWNKYYVQAYILPRESKPFELEDLYMENGGLKEGKKILDELFAQSNSDDDAHEEENEVEQQEPANPSGVRRNAAISLGEASADVAVAGPSTGRAKRDNARNLSRKQPK